ncbi:hypothetical protein Dsin_014964 [Dipteronia sinensis]|uniref:Pre-nudix hydrolase domain-containing protein n=1 Tax=Dipteronia sinensis TaxID=43782 RepID=A0AAE0AP20_9ROSI|nr:hypothetical protein Dsin_014964 [Dipteronia sinensis]
MFKRMLESGVDPDEVVYMTMINAYSDNGQTFEAMQLFEKMIENSIQPGPKVRKQIVLDGLVSCGKSIMLAMFVNWARDEGVDSKEIPEGSSLYDLIQMGIMQTHAAVGVVVRLRKELSLVKDIPVLIATDQQWESFIKTYQMCLKMPRYSLDEAATVSHCYLRFLHSKIQISTVQNFFTSAESKAFIKTAESLGLIHQGNQGPLKGEAYRDNDRISVNDPVLADTIWNAGLNKLFTDIKFRRKVAIGLNPNIRFYRYLMGCYLFLHVGTGGGGGGGRSNIRAMAASGKKGVWIKLPIELVNLVEVAVKEGFWYHHAEPTYLMLVNWIPGGANTLHAHASHRVGVGAFVMNEKRVDAIGRIYGATIRPKRRAFKANNRHICLAKLEGGGYSGFSPVPTTSAFSEQNNYLYYNAADLKRGNIMSFFVEFVR